MFQIWSALKVDKLHKQAVHETPWDLVLSTVFGWVNTCGDDDVDAGIHWFLLRSPDSTDKSDECNSISINAWPNAAKLSNMDNLEMY